ncbi:MAG: PKD domain-containing protein [Mycobacterium sp.]|nr:PKD domain-containing protein [Mycobacterium sp.]
MGGRFGNVNGVKSKGVTLLNTQTGAIVGGFKPPSMNGVVQSLALSGNRLFLGGSFSTLGGVAHAGLGTVNATTGALDPYMNVQLAGHHNYNGSGANGRLGPRAFAINPAGTRLVAVGNFKTADGLPRDQAVMIDLDADSASVDPNWETEQYTAACYSWAFDTYMTDVQYSADGSYFVITATGGGGTNDDGSNSLCDSASRWAAAATGGNVKPTWVDYTGRDSLWSLAITGTAIYVGGHQRWMNNSYGSDNAQAGAVPRPGIAALDPESGVPLAWDAGRNPRGAGAYAMFAASNGLYVGSDTDYFGNFQYKRQKIGLLPLASGTTTAATTTEQLPGNLYQAGQLPSSSNTNVLYRVDAGGPAIGAIDNGPDWMADATNSDPGAQYRNPNNNSAIWSCCATLANTVPSSTPSQIFNSERWDGGSKDDGDEMSWQFPVATGTHVGIRLYFANRYGGTSQPGQRVFDVAVDGNTVLDHYDIVADVGDQTGTMKEFDVTSPGTITISFTHETENPLINGIELINLDAPPGGGSGALDTLTRRAIDGTSIGIPETVSSSIGWGSTRGAFMVGNYIFYSGTNGNFYRVSYNGSTFGTPEVLDPYDDPKWDNVQTGSGQTYQGVSPTFFSEMPSVTGAFYSNGRMYYSLLGQSQLYWRWFSPDSGVIGSEEFTQGGADFSQIAGMVLSGDNLYYASRSDGTLHVMPFVDGVPDSSQDATISGPSIDGVDWRTRGMFIHGHANQKPTASATASCTELSCSFNGSGSSDPDGSVDAYAWDFGDGSTGTGIKPSHTYSSTGTYHVTLTVTDDAGAQSAPFAFDLLVTNQAPSADASVSCSGLSCSFNGSGSSDLDGSVASYAWDFGDGSTGSDVKPSHTYSSTGTYHVTLTVTDDAGAQSAPFPLDVTVDATSGGQVTYVGNAGFNGNTANPSVTLPAGISAGDMELLFVTSGTTGVTTSAPVGQPGWQQLVQRVNGSMEETVFTRVATAGDAGQKVTVPLASSAKVDLRFVDYSGVATVAPTFAVGVDSTTATHVTPDVTVSDPGSWVVSFWSDRTSNNTQWSLPGSVTARGTGYGSGGGRVDAAIADSNGAVAIDTYSGRAASSNATSGKAVMVSLVLGAS